MAPAAPGGGWDQTARTMQNLMQQEKISGNVQVVNVPGAGGTIGIAEAAYQKALRYAQDRVQMGPIIEHADVRRMLARMKAKG